MRSNNPILKFADDTAVLGLINIKNEIPYRSEVSKFVQLFNPNHLQLNVNKTKEMVIDFRRKDTEIMPLKLNDKIVEQVFTYKYLGVTIDEKLHWSDHINNIKSKGNNRLYFVRKLGQFKVHSLPFSKSLLLKVSCLFVLLIQEGIVRRETV